MDPVVRGARWLQVGLVVLIVLAIGASSLVLPFGRDQGAYACIAMEALQGRLPYRDVFWNNPPVTHLVHALALLAFGRSMLSIRVLDLLWQCLTALLVMHIASHVCRRRAAGVLAAALYALSYYLFDFWNTAQTDGFQTLPTAAAVSALVWAQDDRRRWAYVACGAALGVATLLKYPMAALLPMLMAACLVSLRRYALRPVLLMGIGFCFPLTICAVVMWQQAVFQAFVTTQSQYLAQYTAGRLGALGYLRVVLALLTYPSWPTVVLWLSAMSATAVMSYTWRRDEMASALPVALWAMAAAVSYLAQAKGYLYHGLPLLAPYSILGTYVFFGALDRHRTSRRHHLVLAALAEVMVVLPIIGYTRLSLFGGRGEAFADVLLGRRTVQEVYLAPGVSQTGEPGFSLRAEMLAAEYIRSHSEQDDTVFIWGFEPTICFLSSRRAASRFIYNLTLYGKWSWPQFRAQLVRDLVRAPPLYFIVASRDALPIVTMTTDDSSSALEKFATLREFLDENYVQETRIENLTLYRRKAF